MERQTVPALALTLVVLVLASTVAATAPAAAGVAGGPASGTADGPDRQYNQTALVALADAGGGAVVAGGQTDVDTTAGRQANATLMRIGPDGDPDWTTRFEGPNATSVVDVTVADGGDIYFLVSGQPTPPGADRAALRLGRATADGDVVWQEPINATTYAGQGVTLVGTDQGVAVAHRQGDSVRMAEYVGPRPVWERTHEYDADPRSLHRTDGGFLLVGNAGFDDPWVLRTTGSGRERLNETYTGIDAGRVVGAAVTDDGDVLLAGQGRIGLGADVSTAWSARIDEDGAVRWTRVHTGVTDTRVVDVSGYGDGLLLVGRSAPEPDGTGATIRMLGVGAGGAELFDERAEGLAYVTAMVRTGGELRVAGVTGLSSVRDTGFAAELATVSLPDATAGASGTLTADVGLSSNTTVYRGQNVRIERPSLVHQTYDLVRLPGEHDEFEPHAVRRIELASKEEAVLESATLPDGEYVLRRDDGRPVAVEDGRVIGPAEPDEAAFRVEGQRFLRVETNRTFVDVAAGERGVSLTADSGRTGYDVYVTVGGSRGEDPTAAEIEATFDGAPGFVGIETVDGRPAARVTVDSDERITADAGALGPGLYEVTVMGVDTRDGGAVATGRVVVGSERERPVGVELGDRALTVAVGGETRTNVTLTNVTDGIAALSMSANRTGDPAVGLRLRTDINGSIGQGGAGISPHEATASAAEFGGDTPNGTVTVGSLGVTGDAFALDENASGTNTVTVRVDWVVDENGVPYSVPGNLTVTVEVTPAGNATGGADEGRRASGGGSGGERGAEDGSADGAGSGSSSASGGPASASPADRAHD